MVCIIIAVYWFKLQSTSHGDFMLRLTCSVHITYTLFGLLFANTAAVTIVNKYGMLNLYWFKSQTTYQTRTYVTCYLDIHFVAIIYLYNTYATFVNKCLTTSTIKKLASTYNTTFYILYCNHVQSYTYVYLQSLL